MFGLGPTELVIIMVLALVIFGPSRLPKVGQSVGEMFRNFRHVKDTTGKLQDDLKREVEDMVLGSPEGDSKA
jgi:TatA/E family protein of Tat protein translocase